MANRTSEDLNSITEVSSLFAIVVESLLDPVDNYVHFVELLPIDLTYTSGFPILTFTHYLYILLSDVLYKGDDSLG